MPPQRAHPDIGVRIKSALEPKVYRCDFKDCSSTFPTLKQLKTHKETNSDHEYCRKCDINFLTWNEHIQHLYADLAHKNDKMKVCPMCGAEFRSLGGRAKHITQQHPVKHKVTCVGCAKTFNQPSAYIFHIEQGECPSVRKAQLQARIQHKETIKQLLDDPDPQESECGDDSDGGAVLRHPYDGSDVNILSGMPAPEVNELEYPALQAANKREESLSGSAPTLVSLHDDGLGSLWDPNEPNPDFSHVKAWAQQIDGSVPPPGDDPSWAREGVPQVISIPVPIVTKDTTPFPESTNTAHITTRWPSGQWQQADPVLSVNRLDLNDTTSMSFADSSQLIEEDDGENNLFRIHFWDPNHPKFAVDRLYSHSKNKYVCPHPNCEVNLASPQAICNHIIQDHISRIDHRCPECRRRFKTIAALVAHVTSDAIKKCKIRKRESYPEKLALITGGFVGTKDGRRAPLEGGKATTFFHASDPTDLAEEIRLRPRETVVVGRKI